MPTRYLSQDAAGHKILLTAKETQQRLGIGPTTLNKFVRLKWLTPVRFSKRLVRYRTNEIDALIEKFMKNGGCSMTMLTAAKAYAAQGIFILAVGPNKAPILGYGLKTVTNDAIRVEDIWTNHPNAGIAIACEHSNFVVLDCDPRNGGDKTLDTLRQADQEFSNALDTTVQVETQGGGKHFYFAAEVGASYASTLGKGIDIKHRGYVVAPPSKGLAGTYRWTEGKSLNELRPLNAPSLMLRTNQPETHKMETIAHIDLPNDAAITDLRFALQIISADDRDTWIKLGMALKTVGEVGRDLWFEWSKRSTKFNQRDASKTWDSFRPEGTHWKVVFKHANIVADAFIERLHIRGEPSLASKINLNVFNKGVSSVLDQPIKPFTELEANVARLHPRMLVEDYLFADLRNLVAAGRRGENNDAFARSSLWCIRPFYLEQDSGFTLYNCNHYPRRTLARLLLLGLTNHDRYGIERIRTWHRI
jgi:hypothetical protein